MSDINRVIFEWFFLYVTEKWRIFKNRILSQVWFLSRVIYRGFLKIDHSGKIFINGHFSVTALIYETEKWLSSDRRFTDSWLRKWVIIKSSSDTIIEQNE